MSLLAFYMICLAFNSAALVVSIGEKHWVFTAIFATCMLICVDRIWVGLLQS